MKKFVLSGEIDNASVKSVINNILEINESDSREEKLRPSYVREPIILLINSPGGSIYDGFALVDIIKSSKTPVYTVCIGHCMSMGLIIFLSGHKRFIGRNATVMIHGASFLEFGKTPEAEEMLNEVKRLEEVLIDIIVKATKIKRKQIEEIIEGRIDWYISAAQAIKLGIADGFLTSY
jgi:ATP-dependent Clp protease protease subunit